MKVLRLSAPAPPKFPVVERDTAIARKDEIIIHQPHIACTLLM